MIGDLLKSASRVALVAVASITVSGVAAQAADLGGNCCADLEERVAELEATTARKGNRKVALTVYGQVNQAVIFWDDGTEKNQYVVDNNSARTRFGFRGDAKITSDISAGYLLEIGVRYANSGNRNQTAAGAGGNTNTTDIRHSAWYLDSKSLGRVWVGKTSMATDGITEINLANVNSGGMAYDPWNAGFNVRSKTGANTGLTWNSIGNTGMGTNGIGEGDRNNIVRYVSPTFAGFIASAAWGEDDKVDAALRYAGEFSGIRIAAGIGYQKLTDVNNGDGNSGCRNIGGNAAISNVNCEALGMSASVMHTATGLYVTGAYGKHKDNNVNNVGSLAGLAVKNSTNGYYVQGGIEQKWTSLGKTTVFAEYSKHDVGTQVAAADTVRTYGVGGAAIIGSEVKFIGFGINQAIDAAAADFYIHYRQFAGGATFQGTVPQLAVTAATGAPANFQAVMTGMVIRF
jgi:predicted porin